MRRRVNRDRLTAVLMLSPSIVLVGIFVYGFIGSTAWTSLTDSNALQQLSKLPANFVGLRNFTELFTGVLYQRFRTDIVNTVFFTLLFIAVCLAVGILLAILLDQKIKGEGIFRTIFLFPMALSFVVTGVIWKWLFNPNSGLNVLPTFIGLPAGKFNWFVSEERWLPFNWQDVPAILGIFVMGIVIFFALRAWAKHRSGAAAMLAALALLVLAWISFGNPQQVSGLAAPEYHGFNVALIAVVLAAGWQMSGYTMAMYLAGLRGIPDELREAARVDGASEFSVYRRVVFPLLAPITLSAMIILGHISLKIFDLVFALAGGDNLYVDMPGINMWFTTFRGGDFARGAVIAIIMLIMVAVVIIPYLVISLRGEKSL
jgi:glucose/mannose transport system permease protein